MRKFFSCLTLLFFLFTAAACGLQVNDAVVIYDSEDEDGLVRPAEAAENPPEQGGENILAESEILADSETPAEEQPGSQADEPDGENSDGETSDLNGGVSESSGDEPSETNEPDGKNTDDEPSYLNGPDSESSDGESSDLNEPDSKNANGERSGKELMESADPNGDGSGDEPFEVIGLPELVNPNENQNESPGDVIALPERVAVAHDFSALSNESFGWYYNRGQAQAHEPPAGESRVDLSLYDAHHLGDTSQKKVYLTFDPGYEIGLTGRILDTLQEKNVQAAFFLTRSYIHDEPELVQRMVAEGHVPANHSATHPSFPTLTQEEVEKELNDTAQLFADTTGYPMDPFFRPPAGEFSERSLAFTHQMGYTTVFWSFAHVDWIVDEQPTAEETYNKVMNELHNGMVILLHVVSEANTNALPDIIDGIRAEGYEFGSLHDLRD